MISGPVFLRTNTLQKHLVVNCWPYREDGEGVQPVQPMKPTHPFHIVHYSNFLLITLRAKYEAVSIPNTSIGKSSVPQYPSGRNPEIHHY